MSDHVSPSVQAAQRYEASGDIRPPAEELADMLEAMTTPDMSSAQMLRVTDVLIDLAMAEGDISYLADAHDNLTRVIESSTADRDEPPQKLAATGIAARLRLVELPNWQKRAQGEPLTVAHGALLDSAETIFRDYGDVDYCRTRMLGFVPILLGQRSVEWTGRLSLRREGGIGRGRGVYVKSPNWETGLTLQAGSSFENPNVRIQILRSRIKAGEGPKYREAGIIPMSAKGRGFEDPLLVVSSCLAEAGIEPPYIPEGVTLLTGDQLDAITRNIAETAGIE